MAKITISTPITIAEGDDQAEISDDLLLFGSSKIIINYPKLVQTLSATAELAQPQAAKRCGAKLGWSCGDGNCDPDEPFFSAAGTARRLV